MLPLLTSRVAVFIDTQKIVAVRYANRLRKKIIHQEIIHIDQHSDKTETLVLTERLIQLFNEKTFKGYATEFIFSQHYTKQRVAEWNAKLSYEDRKALIHHQLVELYGLNGQSIEIFLSDQGYNKNAVAFTLDSMLYKTINDLVIQKKIKSARMTPYFSTRVNYWHKNIAKDAWVLIHEHHVVHIAKVMTDNWQTFKTYPFSETSSLSTIFKRELLFQEAEDYSNIYLITDSPEKFKDQATAPVLDAKQKLFLLCPDTLNKHALDLRFLAYLD